MLAPEEVRAALERLSARNARPPEGLAGRGIVICAGGARIFTNAYVLVFILRRILKTDLPIEIWHFGAREMAPAMRRLLEELGATTVDAEPVLAAHPARIADGWQLKVYALMRSRFAEVLLLDADQVPVRDPAALFDWPEFAESGAVFWPDIMDLRAENAVWALCGLAAQRIHSFESGQLLVDKRRHWRSLEIALYLNEEAATFYQLVYGDKDTFLIAWLLSGAPSHIVPHPPALTEYGLVQKDRDGAPLFQHLTSAKWSYGRTEPPPPSFTHHAECMAALAALQTKWGGRVFEPPPRSLAARSREAELTGVVLRLTTEDEAEERVRLLPDGEIGEGRTHNRRQWYVVDRDGELALLFSNGDRETFWLQERRPGAWAGRRLAAPPGDVVAAVGEDESLSQAGRRTLVDDLLEAAGFRSDSIHAVSSDLRTALHLLGRRDPSVADRLREVAEDPCWPADARRALETLARELERPAAVDAGLRALHEWSDLRSGYIDSLISDP